MKNRQTLIEPEKVKIYRRKSRWDYSRKTPTLYMRTSASIGDHEGACYVRLRFIRSAVEMKGKEKRLIQSVLEALSACLEIPDA